MIIVEIAALALVWYFAGPWWALGVLGATVVVILAAMGSDP